MKFSHKDTGDVVELPPPNPFTGKSVVIFNGKIVEKCRYSDEEGGYVVAEDGTRFDNEEWPRYLVEKLRTGAWRVIN